ncbi:MAG: S1 RNA-binding domain-containing protein [Anaerolineae bacterium]|nr:S1 RNA-binding domain-containing protein [Anaerolineae bacterium]MDW8102487.1 S1 RNA-binding domain-containing protein [Anaerolineae bacterium]
MEMENFMDEAAKFTPPADWEEVEQLYQAGAVLELPIVGYNRGGFVVQFNSIKGFVPFSQVSFIPYGLSPKERLSFVAGWVGERVKVKIIEVDRHRNRLVLSEREALLEKDGEAFWQRVRPGQVLKGIVTSLRPFGAFVELGGLEGLVHISEISWNRIEHPSQVLKPGQEVDVLVMDVSPQERKIALSIKRLQPDPWVGVEERYRVGQIVKGKVTNVVDFGVFVEVERGLEGLIHVSELAEGNFIHPRNVVEEGDEVIAQVLEVDEKNRKLGLSTRRVPHSIIRKR